MSRVYLEITGDLYVHRRSKKTSVYKSMKTGIDTGSTKRLLLYLLQEMEQTDLGKQGRPRSDAAKRSADGFGTCHLNCLDKLRKFK